MKKINEPSKITTAIQLSPGDNFMLPRQRKIRVVSKVLLFTENDQVPEETKGKLLICYDGCRQLVLSPTDTVIIYDLPF